MLISELSFPHLQAAADARLSLELERRRVVQERLGGQGTGRLRRRAARAGSSERMPLVRVAPADRTAPPSRAAAPDRAAAPEPCPA